MASKQVTAREELERLREVVTMRMRAVDEIDADRSRALMAVELARQAQREYYAGLAPGAKPAEADERRQTDAVEAAERAANAPWDARKEGSRTAVDHARRDVQAFLAQNFERLAAELLPPSMEAQARLAGALDETEQALEAWSNLRFEWSRVAAAVGIPADEVPDLDMAGIQAALPDVVPVPAPASLAGGGPALAAVGANDNERASEMDGNGNGGAPRVGGPSLSVKTSHHGACGGCGQPVTQREFSGDGLVQVFDDVSRTYTPWHPECRRTARGAAHGSLLPTPPRRRWRATDDQPPREA